MDNLVEALEAIPTSHRTVPGACDEWSVKDLLAHLDGWHRMLLRRHTAGRGGGRSELPAPGYTWAQTPDLNHALWEQHRHDGWDEISARFGSSAADVRSAIESYSDEELFAKKQFAWTGSTSVWSYAVSATSSHHAWASKLVRAFAKSIG
ncbi:MAG: ClbS/DfsB family four-helix bundle protein [Acidimicrobiia bacterium]|nr:ClbS/DfsB family four-helix bundle protein [Acidimicrobiia bacterium]MDH4309192.1 ClbS/DfsB family four-helix bundle protein [Acidimicrobiia bacterium]MDH5292974.1 ClbS/DfsB family four-helix bundle protein [Acidimicrobiia bacterium]MDH5521553.1 ClbS/DfsB family four-helix bundle protein [Acidimicrobiia bacterium]